MICGKGGNSCSDSRSMEDTLCWMSFNVASFSGLNLKATRTNDSGFCPNEAEVNDNVHDQLLECSLEQSSNDSAVHLTWRHRAVTQSVANIQGM